MRTMSFVLIVAFMPVVYVGIGVLMTVRIAMDFGLMLMDMARLGWHKLRGGIR